MNKWGQAQLIPNLKLTVPDPIYPQIVNLDADHKRRIRWAFIPEYGYLSKKGSST